MVAACCEASAAPQYKVLAARPGAVRRFERNIEVAGTRNLFGFGFGFGFRFGGFGFGFGFGRRRRRRRSRSRRRRLGFGFGFRVWFGFDMCS